MSSKNNIRDCASGRHEWNSYLWSKDNGIPSKIVLSQTNDTWLLKLREESKVTEVLVMESAGCDTKEIATIISESIETLISESDILPDWDDHNKEVEICITTRQMQREMQNKSSSKGVRK